VNADLPLLIVLLGPTASGKTDLGIAIAQALDLAVLSVDSRQLYQEMDIGTAKPTATQRAAVRHELLDLRRPDQPINLQEFRAEADRAIAAEHHRRGIALAHSGRKGTELDIATATVEALLAATGAQPSDLIAQISPCIRPPHYEVDFAAEIRAQLARAGLREIHDCHTCTFSNPDAYYSYRREEGSTGRLLAALALAG